MKKQSYSLSTLLQVGCSAILLISCLLPWLNFASIQEPLSGNFNFTNMPFQTINDAGISTNVAMPVGGVSDFYRILSYIILFAILVNVGIQFKKKMPLFTFYACIIPTFFSYVCWARVADCGNLLECAGIGLYIANISGTIAIIAAWTELGRSYSEHEGLFRFCRRWSIVCLLLPILILISGTGLKIQSFEAIHTILFVLIGIGFIIWIMGILQIPFLIYARLLNYSLKRKAR